MSPGLIADRVSSYTSLSDITGGTVYQTSGNTLSSILQNTTHMFAATRKASDSYNSYSNVGTWQFHSYVIDFTDINNNILIRYNVTDPTRVVNADSTVSFTNFPAKSPQAAGVIAYMHIWYGNLDSNGSGLVNPLDLLYTVSDPGAGGDIQIANRTLVTGQPWILNGGFKFAVSGVYNYSI